MRNHPSSDNKIIRTKERNPMSVSETSAVTQPSRDSRADEVSALLVGAVDLHCHSGPAAMPRVLDHHEAMMDCAAAGFRALLYKDHYYLGVPHAVILEKLFPDSGVRLFSGLVLNNANGGINPHAVDHAASIGAKIIWMPTVSAANHIAQMSGQGKTFPKTKRKMLEASPLSALDANGAISDEAKACLDIIADANMILAGGHLPAAELHLLFAEAKRRGVKKMLVNHPTYLIGCTDEDIRRLVEVGAFIEHSICMFADGKAKKFSADNLAHLINVAGVDHTILSSDLGLLDNPRPVEGFRQIVRILLDLQFSKADIRKLVNFNAAGLLDLD
jgi:hypothetical protein